MIKKMNVIKTNDFEKYRVLLPFTAITGKRKKQYLCSELEKMHPCFSDEFAYDSVIKGISLKGLPADVLVINKYKLAEYEGRRKFSGSGFLIENDISKNSRKIAHRFFIHTKWKLSLLTIVGILVVGIAGAICGSHAKPVSSVSEANDFENYENNEINETEDFSLSEKFFEAVSSSNGIVSDFQWKTDGLMEFLNASVKGIYPEDLSVLSENKNTGETVSYEHGLPYMQVSYSKKINALKLKSDIKGKLDNSDFNKAVRNLLSEYGADLKEEKAPPYHIEFSVQRRTQIKELLTKLSEMILQDNRFVTEVSIKVTGNSDLQAGISIERETSAGIGFDVSLLAEYLNFFKDIKKNVETVAKKSVLKSEQTKKISESENPKLRTKIGEIKRADNTYLVFYKNADGKIESYIQKEKL